MARRFVTVLVWVAWISAACFLFGAINNYFFVEPRFSRIGNAPQAIQETFPKERAEQEFAIAIIMLSIGGAFCYVRGK